MMLPTLSLIDYLLGFDTVLGIVMCLEASLFVLGAVYYC